MQEINYFNKNKLMNDIVLIEKTYYFLESKILMIIFIIVLLMTYLYKITNNILISIILPIVLLILFGALLYRRFNQEISIINNRSKDIINSHVIIDNNIIINNDEQDDINDCIIALKGSDYTKLLFDEHSYYIPNTINISNKTINVIEYLNSYKKTIINKLKKISYGSIILSFLIALLGSYLNNNIFYILNIILLILVLILVMFNAYNLELNRKK